MSTWHFVYNETPICQLPIFNAYPCEVESLLSDAVFSRLDKLCRAGTNLNPSNLVMRSGKCPHKRPSLSDILG